MTRLATGRNAPAMIGYHFFTDRQTYPRANLFILTLQPLVFFVSQLRSRV